MTEANREEQQPTVVPHWTTLPPGSTKTTFNEVKIGDRVRIFVKQLKASGNPHTPVDKEESDDYIDADVIGISYNGTSKVIGWKEIVPVMGFAKPADGGTLQPPHSALRIANYDEYKSGRYIYNSFLCYLLPEVKPEPTPKQEGKWVETLPAEAKLATLQNAKIGDKVRVFYKNGKPSSAPTDEYADVSVVGDFERSHKFVGSRNPNAKFLVPRKECTKPTNAIDNIEDFPRTLYHASNHQCYILPTPEWEKSLPKGAKRATLKDVKLGDRVRLFYPSEKSFSGSREYETTSETDYFSDATVIGMSNNRVPVVGWKENERKPWSHAIDDMVLSSITVPNVNDFKYGLYPNNGDTLCYIFPETKPEPAKEPSMETQANPIDALKLALKVIEGSVNQVISTDTTLTEKQKTDLKVELDKLMAIDIQGSSKPSEPNPPKEETITTLSEAKLGDTVKVFITQDGWWTNNIGERQIEATVIGLTTQPILGWKSQSVKYGDQQSPSEAVKNAGAYLVDLSDFVGAHAAGEGNRCIIVKRGEYPKPKEPEVITTLKEAKVGDRVKVWVNDGGYFSGTPTGNPVEATVIATGGSAHITLGFDAPYKNCPDTICLDSAPQKRIRDSGSAIQLEDLSSFALARNAGRNNECVILKRAENPKTKPVFEEIKAEPAKEPTAQSIKIGDVVKVYVADDGYLQSPTRSYPETMGYSFECVIIGENGSASNGSWLVGLKSNPAHLKAIVALDDQKREDLKKFASLPITDYPFVRWVGKTHSKVEVIPNAQVKTEPAKEEPVKEALTPKVGSRVRLHISDDGFVQVAFGRPYPATKGYTLDAVIVEDQNTNWLLGLKEVPPWFKGTYAALDKSSEYPFLRVLNKTGYKFEFDVLPEEVPVPTNETPAICLKDAKIGDVVRVFYNQDGGLTRKEGGIPAIATILGDNNGLMILGIEDEDTKLAGFASIENFKNKITVKDYSNLRLARSVSPNEFCEIVKPAEEAPKPEPTSSKEQLLSNAKVGDVVELPMSSSGYLSMFSGKDTTTITATIVGIDNGAPLLGFSSIPYNLAATMPASAHSSRITISNPERFPYVRWAERTQVCKIVQPAASEQVPAKPKKLSSAQIGERVRVYYSKSGVSKTPTDKSFEATVVGKTALNVLLAMEEAPAGLSSIKPMSEIKPFDIKFYGDPKQFKYARWANVGVQYETVALPADEPSHPKDEPKTEPVQQEASTPKDQVKIGDRVRVFYNDDGFLAKDRTGLLHTFEAVIIGEYAQNSDWVLGVKERPEKLRNLRRINDIDEMHIKLPSISEYLFARYMDKNNSLFEKLPPISSEEPMQERKLIGVEQVKVGDVIRVFYDNSGYCTSYAHTNPTSRSFEATVIHTSPRDIVVGLQDIPAGLLSTRPAKNLVSDAKGFPIAREISRYNSVELISSHKEQEAQADESIRSRLKIEQETQEQIDALTANDPPYQLEEHEKPTNNGTATAAMVLGTLAGALLGTMLAPSKTPTARVQAPDELIDEHLETEDEQSEMIAT